MSSVPTRNLDHSSLIQIGYIWLQSEGEDDVGDPKAQTDANGWFHSESLHAYFSTSHVHMQECYIFF